MLGAFKNIVGAGECCACELDDVAAKLGAKQRIEQSSLLPSETSPCDCFEPPLITVALATHRPHNDKADSFILQEGKNKEDCTCPTLPNTFTLQLLCSMYTMKGTEISKRATGAGQTF